jgi:hypothetical protein
MRGATDKARLIGCHGLSAARGYRLQWVGLLLHEVACRNQPSPFPGIDLDDHSGHRGDAMIGGGEAKGARRLVRAVPKAALGTICAPVGAPEGRERRWSAAPRVSAIAWPVHPDANRPS